VAVLLGNEDWAGNFVMHVLADDLPGRAHIASLDVAARYGVEPPRPKLEPWAKSSPMCSTYRASSGILPSRLAPADQGSVHGLPDRWPMG
jgi:hypothetical protein